MDDAVRAGGRHGDIDDQASDVRRTSGCWSFSSRRRPGGRTANRSWRSTAWVRAGVTSVLVTNDGRELQEKLGPTTPGRWSVIGLPDDGQDRRRRQDDEDRRSDRTSDAVAIQSPAQRRPVPDRAADAACRPDRGLADRGEEVVVYDNLGAGPGSLIGLSEGREAANPFGKTKTPVDAYCACLIDQYRLSDNAEQKSSERRGYT